jgi:signal peptidase II
MASSRRLYALLGLVAAAVIAIDQLTKNLALAGLADAPVELPGGFVTLRLTYNSGGAFGLLQGLPGFFLVATVVVIAVLLVWARKLKDPIWAIPLGMVLGGGIGNLIDRIIRDTGGRVVDFIDLHWWPVFNLADAAIVTGVAIIVLLSGRRSIPGGEEPDPARRVPEAR